MKMFVVTSATGVSVSSGVLRLSKEQAADRTHQLESLGKGEYQVKFTTQFKRGERFGYDGELPKHLVEHLTPAPANSKPATLDMKQPGLLEKAMNKLLQKEPESSTSSGEEVGSDSEDAANTKAA